MQRVVDRRIAAELEVVVAGDLIEAELRNHSTVAIDREEGVGAPIDRDGFADRGERFSSALLRGIRRLAFPTAVGGSKRLLQGGVDASDEKCVDAAARVDLERPLDRLAIGREALFERTRGRSIVLADGDVYDVKGYRNGKAEQTVPGAGENHHLDSPPADSASFSS